MLKATNEQILAAYQETGNIWRTAEKLGMCGQSVHERLVKLNIPLNNPAFNEEDYKKLEEKYLLYRDAGQLDLLAKEMGRTKQFICRKAKKLNLTDRNHKSRWLAVWKYMPEEVARSFLEKFKHSKYTMKQFCNKFGYDDLGFSRTMKQFFPDEWDAVIESKTPKQTMSRYGRAFEYRSRDDLRKRGIFVLRSPRSGSPIDLEAIRKREILFIQCKRGGELMVKDWNELYDLALSVDAKPILAECKDGMTKSYWLLIGKKDGSKHRQPKELFIFNGGIYATDK